MGNAKPPLNSATLYNPPNPPPAVSLRNSWCRATFRLSDRAAGIRSPLFPPRNRSAPRQPRKHQRERGRLVDSFIDGHKYVFEKRAVVYGDEDLVIGLTSFLTEIGITPVLCATGPAAASI